MRATRIAAVWLLACSLPALSRATAPEDLRLGGAVVPTFEAVSLVLDPAKTGYSGSARIDLKVRERASSFRFHAEGMKLERIALSPPPAGLSHERGRLGLVTVSARAPLEPGDYTLEIDFSHDFGTRAVGLYRMELDGEAYAFTQFEADDARKAFPCWDEPGFKIPYQLTLAIPEGHLAVTNAPAERETVTDGSRTIVFKRTPPLPSYLLAIAAGPLETVDIPGMSIPGRVVTVKGRARLAAAAVRMTPPILAALERYFDRKYPFDKLDLIAVPEYWPGAMENPGAITFSEPILLSEPGAESAADRRSLASVVAHELAHIWFGDLVTMEWWDDLWLNESFADWMGDKITEQVHPEFDLALSELRGIQGIMSSDARPSTQAIRRRVEPDDNKMQNVGVAYNKGKAVLGMFERWIGPETFRRGVLDYLQAHAWDNATAADLWAALSKASGKDVSAAMAAFLDQGGLPLVTAEALAGGRLKLGQRRFLNHGAQAPPLRWRIPLTLKYSDGAAVHTRSLLLAEETQILDLLPEGELAWVLPDADAAGYYRWSVPPAMLETLARESRRILSARERIGFIGNLHALLMSGSIRGDGFLEALGRFADDPEPQVLSALAGTLAEVKLAFVPDELKGAFARYVRDTLGPALDRFGLSRRPGEKEAVSLFRPELLAWLGDEGRDERALQHAESLARSYLVDPASVDPALVGVSLRLAAIRGDRKLFAEYRGRFESAQVPEDRARYLSALGSFRDPALAQEALKYALQKNVRPQEIRVLLGRLRDTARGRDRVYRFLTENYEAITSRMPPQFVAYMPFYAGGCEAARLGAARAFFSDPARGAPGMEASLARVADQVGDCVALRQREGAVVAAHLGREPAIRGASR